VVSSETKSVVLLVWAVRNGSDFSAESLCPEESEVSTIFMSGRYAMRTNEDNLQSTNTDDGNVLAWSAAKTDKRRVHSDTYCTS